MVEACAWMMSVSAAALVVAGWVAGGQPGSQAGGG